VTEDDHLKTLAAIAAEREPVEAALAELRRREHDAIQAAWRAKVRPSKIATAAKRTGAHIRALRPDDVPPARLGGGAATPNRRGHGAKGGK
jgi:hypothetical protein